MLFKIFQLILVMNFCFDSCYGDDSFKREEAKSFSKNSSSNTLLNNASNYDPNHPSIFGNAGYDLIVTRLFINIPFADYLEDIFLGNDPIQHFMPDETPRQVRLIF